ncbi:MAG TPA: RluA family pseudouridine synthase [Acidimicrobiia bacterium]|nr:RluA family pseudouridine synthase [Acidimicrobiia bacterium]
MTENRQRPVPADLEGVRADRAVAQMFELSRNAVRTLIDDGAVLIDGSAAVPAQRLAAGQIVTATIPEPPPRLEPAPVPFDVVYLDDDVLVVDKPAGLVVHPGAGTTAPTLVAGVVHRFPDQAGLEAERWGLVHRLDRDTSGLLVVARTSTAFRALQTALRARSVARTYLALVEGVPDSARGTIDAPLGRDPHQPTKVAVLRDGRVARTHFRRVAGWPSTTLLEVRLETGRTHQIRVHLASIGHPVIGDSAYGGRRRAHPADAGRQWLHAARLEFAHPTTGVAVCAVSPPPPDLTASLDGLGVPETGAIPSWQELLGTTTPSP